MPIACRHPALMQAFAGVAEAKQKAEGELDGVVKVTAYEHMEGYDKSGDQTRVEILFFPEGLWLKIFTTKPTLTLLLPLGASDDVPVLALRLKQRCWCSCALQGSPS